MIAVERRCLNIFGLMLYVLVAAVLSACVPSVSAEWTWEVKNAEELAAQGMQLTKLLGDLQYEPENSASEFKDTYGRGGRFFESTRNRKIDVQIYLNPESNKIDLIISENSTATLSPSGYEHYVALKNVLNAKFRGQNIKHTIYHSSFNPGSKGVPISSPQTREQWPSEPVLQRPEL